jgi:hypothetical protein
MRGSADLPAWPRPCFFCCDGQQRFSLFPDLPPPLPAGKRHGQEPEQPRRQQKTAACPNRTIGRQRHARLVVAPHAGHQRLVIAARQRHRSGKRRQGLEPARLRRQQFHAADGRGHACALILQELLVGLLVGGQRLLTRQPVAWLRRRRNPRQRAPVRPSRRPDAGDIAAKTPAPGSNPARRQPQQPSPRCF